MFKITVFKSGTKVAETTSPFVPDVDTLIVLDEGLFKVVSRGLDMRGHQGPLAVPSIFINVNTFGETS